MWLAYYEKEPLSKQREGLFAAQITAMIANVNRAQGTKAYTLDDVLLRFGNEKKQRKQTWQEQVAMWKALAASFAAEGKS